MVSKTYAPPRGRNQATVKCFGSFTKLLTSLIAEWYGVSAGGPLSAARYSLVSTWMGDRLFDI